MNTKLLSHPYMVINLILITLILFFLLYFIIFSSGSYYPFHSNYDSITGKTSISSGLSRSFSAAVRFNLKQANFYNPYGIQLFSFVIIQFIIRSIITIVIIKTGAISWFPVATDALISITLFILLFRPFLTETIHLLQIFFTHTTLVIQ